MHMATPKIVVDKSTVPVGTAEKVREVIAEQLTARGVDVGKSLSADKRTTAKKKVPKGQGDRGDTKR